MQIVAVISICLGLMSAGKSPAATIAGLWVMNQVKSDFGGTNPPEHIVIQVDPGDQGLTVAEMTIEHARRRVDYRHVSLDGKDCQMATVFRMVPAGICWIVPTRGETIDESWRISDLGELIIERLVVVRSQVVHERIVLEPSARVID
jgi:hypothetical protein